MWLAAWLLAVDKSRGSKSVEVQRVWEMYDDRLQYVAQTDDSQLDGALQEGNIYLLGCVVWLRRLLSLMRAALLVVLLLAGVFCAAAVFRVLGSFGLEVPRFVRLVAMLLHWMEETYLCIGLPILDLRRRRKVVMDVLGEMIRRGFILARSPELIVQRDCILGAGPVHPVSVGSGCFFLAP